MRRRMAVGVWVIVVTGGLVSWRVVGNAERSVDGAQGERGVVAGAVVTMMEEGQGYARWIVRESGGGSAVWGRGGREVVRQLLDGSIEVGGVREDEELRWLMARIDAGDDGMAVGVTRKAGSAGLEIVRFGDFMPGSETLGRNLDVVRSVQGERESELLVRVKGCDEGELAVFQRVGGDAAREWSSGRPAGLVEWAVADDFWIEVQYPLGYEKIAVRSRREGVLERRIEFGFEDAALGQREKGTLREVGEFLRGNAGIDIIIEGHTDDRGGKKYNEELGLKRARAVQRFLVDEGIERTRMGLVSCGKRMPLVRVVPSMPSEAHARNRRVEFRIAVPWAESDAM